MAAEWYVRVGNAERGPILAERLKQLALEGKVSPDTLVKKGPSGNWVPANQVKGLFGATVVSTVAPRMPPHNGRLEPDDVIVAAVRQTDLLVVRRPSQTLPAVAQAEPEPEGFNKSTLIAMWSCVGMVALGCVCFLAWYTHSEHRAKIIAANDRITQAVAAANQWIGSNSPVDGEAVEQRLANAVATQDATEKARGEAMLAQVRNQRKQLADRPRIEKAQREANAIFEEAQRQIDAKHVTQATGLLKKYIADPYATNKTEAERLLAEAEAAVSDTLTLDALIVMSAQEYDRAKTTGTIDDGKVTNPMLLAVRKETIQRNVGKAAQRRDEIKAANQAANDKPKERPDATAPTISKIDGAFGMRLGEVFNPAAAIGESSTTAKETMYEFAPSEPFRSFKRYFLLLTPKTHRIYCIWAIGNFETRRLLRRSRPS